MRILSLDYGRKRIGVALSDELGITARGIATITRTTRERDIEKISRMVEEYGVEEVVIGYPLRLDGTEGIQCEKVSRFADMLGARLSVPIVKWDESFSTQDAEALLIEADVKPRKRKQLVDKIAAVIILQGYLNKVDQKGLQSLPK